MNADKIKSIAAEYAGKRDPCGSSVSYFIGTLLGTADLCIEEVNWSSVAFHHCAAPISTLSSAFIGVHRRLSPAFERESVEERPPVGASRRSLMSLR